MIKQYIIKYKLFTMPWYYEFTTYAESGSEALAAFIKAEPFGVERYYISAAIDI